MRHVARETVAVGRSQRFHQMPAGEIGGADIADLAGANELVERRQSFFDRGLGILAMQLEEIDMIGAEPLQRGVDRLDQMLARGAEAVRTGAGRKRALGGDQQAVALALDRLAEDLLRASLVIDIRAVEHRDAAIEADVDHTCSTGRIDRPPIARQPELAKIGAAQAEHRHLKTRTPETPDFHVSPMTSPRSIRDETSGY